MISLAKNNISIKSKLIGAFLLIILINAAYGIFNLSVIGDISELVNVTYDKALMSGNFAQASKFDFSQIDIDLRSALLATDETEFNRHIKLMEKADETLREDLSVVAERALSPKAASLIEEFREGMKELMPLRDQLTLEKRELLSKGKETGSLELLRRWLENSDRKKLYRKLNTINDDAAVVGYEFRLDSEAKNKKSRNLTAVILLACFILSFILASLVALIILRPLSLLQDICKKVSTGDLSVRTKLQTTDEFGTLGSSFDFMLNTIQDKSENITSLLSSLPFGLFYFDKQGNISTERSRSTDVLFPEFTSYQTLSHFYELNGVPVKKLNDILDAIYSNLLPFNSAADLLPRKLLLGRGEDQKIIKLIYRPKFLTKKKVDRVIVLAEDITEFVRSQEKTRELMERVDRISRVSADIPGFKEFLRSVNDLYDDVEKNLRNYTPQLEIELKRNLHTLKGVLGIYSFSTCVTGVNEIESFLEIEIQTRIKEAREKIYHSRQLFTAQGEDVSGILQLDAKNNVGSYDHEKIESLKKLAGASGNKAITDILNNLGKFPLEKVFSKYLRHVQALSEKLGKIVDVTCTSDTEISYEEVSKLDTVFIHLINNSLDHGMESPEDRKVSGKTEKGHLNISCSRFPGMLEFRITDDGRGIDGDRVLTKALEKGLISQAESENMSENKKFELVFLSGLTTKDSFSETSGRGVGLDAVRDLIISLGGSIDLESTRGKGTQFKIKVPV